MSLFSRLLSLNTGSIPLEDFFTEIVAYLFRTDKKILYAWLDHCDLAENSYSDAYVLTQKSYQSPKHHDLGSRPDLVIDLIDGDNHDLIFVESKIGSKEGYQQLSRYAEILDKLPNIRHKWLIYITRDFDPKDKSEILQPISTSQVQFKQLRWHQFYRFLKSQKKEGMLVQEILEFMQEYNMAHNNQFSSLDVLVLANFTKSLRLMEEVMWGKVKDRFIQVIGTVRASSTALTQVRHHERYLMTADMPSGKWWCGLGFYLATSEITDYPSLRLVLEVDPNSSRRAEIIDAMKGISNTFGWSEYGLNGSIPWVAIFREKSLQDFLAQEDHIVATQQFFLDALDELEEIKRQYPHLPWLATPDKNEDEDIEDELSP